MDRLQKLLGALGADAAFVEKSEEEYREAVRQFLIGLDFMRLGHCIQGKQWHLVLSNSARLKQHCSELGITCFDNYLRAIRDAARRQNEAECLQSMSRITAKRVQLRNMLAEDNETCDM